MPSVSGEPAPNRAKRPRRGLSRASAARLMLAVPPHRRREQMGEKRVA
eukprot:gene31999-29194_t